MGGLFSAPSPAPVPQPEAVVDPGTEEESRRRELIERKRRGRRGTIATSPKGVLATRNDAGNRRSLLGE